MMLNQGKYIEFIEQVNEWNEIHITNHRLHVIKPQNKEFEKIKNSDNCISRVSIDFSHVWIC